MIRKNKIKKRSGFIFTVTIFLALVFLFTDLLVRKQSSGSIYNKLRTRQNLRLSILNSQTETMNKHCSKLTIDPTAKTSTEIHKDKNLTKVSIITDSSKSRFLAYYEASSGQTTQGTLESLTKKGLETITIVENTSSIRNDRFSKVLQTKCKKEMFRRLEKTERNFEYLKVINKDHIRKLYKTLLQTKSPTESQKKNIEKATKEAMRNLKQFTL